MTSIAESFPDPTYADLLQFRYLWHQKLMRGQGGLPVRIIAGPNKAI